MVVLDSSSSVMDVQKWIVPPELNGKVIIFGNQLVFATPKAGKYLIGLAVADKTPSVDFANWTVVIGDVKPEPQPEPGPKPIPPTPEPNLEKGSFITFIEESTGRPRETEMIAMMNDVAWRQKIIDAGFKVGWYDVDSDDVKGWASKAKEVGLPAIVIVSPGGKLVKAMKAPKTTAEVDAVIFGGAK